jgi:hypothetical protein
VLFSAAAAVAQNEGWPRQRTTADGYQVTVYQPQIDDWDDGYSKIAFSGVVAVTAPGGEKAALASYRATAATDTSFADRTVRVHDVRLADIQFPGLSAAAVKTSFSKVQEVVPKERVFGLDEVLAYVQLGQERAAAAKSAPVVQEPPIILVSETLAVLVLFDGDPLWAPIEGTGLRFALNTNWDLFEDGPSMRLFLLYDDAWLAAPSLEGPWAPAGALPAGFKKLPSDDNWKAARDNQPGRKLKAVQVPAVRVATEPAELILLKGAPKLAAIDGTGLSWVTNSENDLFFDSVDSQFYFLVSGRWFRAAKLEGPWKGTSGELPADFAAIPVDHPRARVRPSVPGTPEAEEAILLAQVPRRADVKRAGTTVDVTYAGDPEWKPIEGTSMSYAANTSFDVIRIGDLYYACFQGVWFMSTSATGPWAVTPDVPGEVYTIPPSSPKYNVTYVTVYDSTPDTVVYGYTSGYWGMYVAWGVVVFGTGYYYPPYIYAGPHYPYYYPYGYSYGAAAWYNPATGVYGRAAAVYGPYGGMGAAAAYNPRTGTYGRSAYAYGPYQAGWAGRAYNPRTDTTVAGYQRSNSYAQWGETVVSRGDDWAHVGHYTDDRGTVAGARTSEGGRVVGASGDDGRGFVGQSGEGDVYAGKDGNIYKREDGGGWSKYEDGGWNNVDSDRPQDRSAQADQRAQSATPAQQQKAQEARSQAQAPRTQPATGERPAATQSGASRPSTASPSTGSRPSTTSAAASRPAAASPTAATWDSLQRDAQARSAGSQRTQQYSGGGAARSGARSAPAARSGGARRRG